MTDAELYELETLLIEKYENFDFSKTFINIEKTEVLIKDQEFIDSVKFLFNNRYEIRGEDFFISIHIFKILQSRYFRNNQTVSF